METPMSEFPSSVQAVKAELETAPRAHGWY